jgi:hypothetical protein
VVAASSTNSSRWHFLVFTAFAQASGAGTFSPIASSVTDLGLGVLGFLALEGNKCFSFSQFLLFLPAAPHYFCSGYSLELFLLLLPLSLFKGKINIKRGAYR